MGHCKSVLNIYVPCLFTMYAVIALNDFIVCSSKWNFPYCFRFSSLFSPARHVDYSQFFFLLSQLHSIIPGGCQNLATRLRNLIVYSWNLSISIFSVSFSLNLRHWWHVQFMEFIQHSFGGIRFVLVQVPFLSVKFSSIRRHITQQMLHNSRVIFLFKNEYLLFINIILSFFFEGILRYSNSKSNKSVEKTHPCLLHLKLSN